MSFHENLELVIWVTNHSAQNQSHTVLGSILTRKENSFCFERSTKSKYVVEYQDRVS